MKYIIKFNGKIEIKAKNKQEAEKEAKIGILYGLDDMITEKTDYLKIKSKKQQP